MKPIDIENIYNNLPVVYINRTNISWKIGDSSGNILEYIHVPMVYSGERLGYMFVFVCKKVVYILKYMDGSPYIIDNVDDVYRLIKNELGIKYIFGSHSKNDDILLFGVSGDYFEAKYLEKLHDNYFRGYFDERIQQYKDIANDSDSDSTTEDTIVPKKRSKYIHHIYILIIIILTLLYLYLYIINFNYMLLIW